MKQVIYKYIFYYVESLADHFQDKMSNGSAIDVSTRVSSLKVLYVHLQVVNSALDAHAK